MQQISISDIQRNLHKLNDFDVVEVIDKKRNKVKGYFIDSKYAPAIKELIIKQKQSDDTAEKLAGCLHEYTNNNLIESEKRAWQEQIKKKYPL